MFNIFVNTAIISNTVPNDYKCQNDIHIYLNDDILTYRCRDQGKFAREKLAGFPYASGRFLAKSKKIN